MHKTAAPLLQAALLSAILTGCASTNVDELIPDRRVDYRKTAAGNSLEVPPDLTSSTIDDSLVVPELNPKATANLSDYNDERQENDSAAAASETVLSESAAFSIERDGTRRWLVVNQPPTALWQQVKSFWTDNGFRLDRADPRIGIMETSWLENRADIPDGPVRNLLKNYLDFAYSTSTRDRFRVRLDPGVREDGGSEIYLTHYGVEEVFAGPNNESLVWKPRERDPELEAEMLNRLMVHLGAEDRRAKAALANPDAVEGPRTRLVDTSDGYRALVIEEGYDRAWRLVGLALDGSDFAIEDQNRAQGLYLIGPPLEGPRSVEKDDGFLSRLAFWRSDKRPKIATEGQRYRVRLAGRGEQTMVIVQTNAGVPDTSPAAEEILESVREIIQ